MKSESTGLNNDQSKKLKVLYIADPVEVGGASKSLVDVVSEMSQRGVECIVCTSEHGNIERDLNKSGVVCITDGHMAAMEVPPVSIIKKVPVYILRRYQYKKSIKKAIETITSKVDFSSIDLIHTNSARNDLGCELAKNYAKPHVMHIREFGKEDFGCWTYKKNYIKILNEETDWFICISNAVRSSWEKKGIDARRMLTIYNGVDETKIIPITNPKHYTEKKFKMVIVGGICEAKGQIEAIRALGFVPDEIRKMLYLDIIGWGNEKYINKIKEEVTRNHLEDHVKFLGAKDDIGEKLQDYQVGLMCSKAEGFGRVTIEYMHAGLGVIASNTGANEEIVSNGATGLIYEKGNPQSLAEKIEEYFIHRDKLFEYAQNGYYQAKERFTKKINADKIYSFYMKIVNKNLS